MTDYVPDVNDSRYCKQYDDDYYDTYQEMLREDDEYYDRMYEEEIEDLKYHIL